MSERDMHPVDDLLLRSTGNPGPTEADTIKAKNALTEAIALERTHRLRGQVRWKRPLVAVGALVVGVIVAIGLTQAPNPSPAQAALLEIARAAEVADPLTIPAQSYAYTYSESRVLGVSSADIIAGRDKPLPAILPQTTEKWVGQDGTSQIRRTFGTPTFFSEQDEKEFYAAGLDDLNQIGETTTRTLSGDTSALDDADWSHDPDDLLKQIKDVLGWRATDAEIVQFTLTLLRETGASPALRASVLRVVSDLNGLTIVDQTASTTAFRIEFEDHGAFQLDFVLDDSGQLLGEQLVSLDGDPNLGIPPNTPVNEVEYKATVTVGDLTAP